MTGAVPRIGRRAGGDRGGRVPRGAGERNRLFMKPEDASCRSVIETCRDAAPVPAAASGSAGWPRPCMTSTPRASATMIRRCATPPAPTRLRTRITARSSPFGPPRAVRPRLYPTPLRVLEGPRPVLACSGATAPGSAGWSRVRLTISTSRGQGGSLSAPPRRPRPTVGVMFAPERAEPLPAAASVTAWSRPGRLPACRGPAPRRVRCECSGWPRCCWPSCTRTW